MNLKKNSNYEIPNFPIDIELADDTIRLEGKQILNIEDEIERYS